MISEQIILTAGWASWSGIFAGAVTALAVSILMAIFGVALGFAVIKPKSDDMLSGMNVAFGGWSFVSVVLSMTSGGFIAGLFAGQRGFAHGFLVWALVTITATALSGIAISSFLNAIGIAVKSIGAGTASAVTAVSKGVSEKLSDALADMREHVDIDVDSRKMNDTVMQVLRDTGVESLQPEHLQQELQEVRADFRGLLRKLALQPAEYRNVIAGFVEKEKERLEGLSGNIDKSAAVQALMKRRSIPRDEAETMVDNAVTAYEQVVEKAKRTFRETGEHIDDIQRQLEEAADKAREKADRLSSAAAKAGLAAGIALVLAAVICAFAGNCGATYSAQWMMQV